MTKILVLGGTGFLGRHVARLAAQQGHQVASLSRREGCDMKDLARLTSCLAALEPDAVIDCAAHVGSVHYVTRFAADVVDDNLRMVLNLYRGVHRACPNAVVINPIANCSYPGPLALQREEKWLEGPVHDSVLAYGNARRMVGVLAECYWRQYGLRSVNWIVPNAYGPGDDVDPEKVHALNGILVRMIQSQRAGAKEMEIWGSGRPVREWCYVEDAARMLVESVHLQAQVEPVNLAQKQGFSIAEIARIAADCLRYDVKFVYNTQYADGAPAKTMDDTRFRERFPEFRFTPLARGIAQTVAYYEETLAKKP